LAAQSKEKRRLGPNLGRETGGENVDAEILWTIKKNHNGEKT